MLKSSLSLLTGLIISLAIIVVSCGDKDKWAGKYLSTTSKNQQGPAISLELMADGNGSWATEEDSVSFKWEVRGNEVLLHTKSGGIIAGKIKGDSIEVNLPGMAPCQFRSVAR
ncbi:MAG: hypothetical protein KJ573_09140 [Proteobacteria bacterium]|nr:hypothetical protein [Desulfobacteraceae bacterium]MBU0733672.1 hypothetical protein [Pseudomonadota bacterium]MBU1903739.1 hypothetical protein [Pseudomonadota bacterium]